MTYPASPPVRLPAGPIMRVVPATEPGGPSATISLRPRQDTYDERNRDHRHRDHRHRDDHYDDDDVTSSCPLSLGLFDYRLLVLFIRLSLSRLTTVSLCRD